MRLQVHHRGSMHIFCAGELDCGTADTFQAVIEQSSSPELIVDVGNLTFIDAAGLNAFINTAGTRDILIANAPAHIARVFELGGLAGLLYR